MKNMKKVAVIYHSGFGHTEILAESILTGVKNVDGIEAKLFEVEPLIKAPDLLNEYDAIIMGSPTYMGSVSAKFKEFMEASSRLWFEQKWKNKIAAGFTNSHSLSGDKLNALIQLAVFAAQHGMIWVSQAEPNGSPDGEPGKSNALNRMGSSLGLMAQSENDAPEVTPPKGDKETARLFGKRVAEITSAISIG